MGAAASVEQRALGQGQNAISDRDRDHVHDHDIDHDHDDGDGDDGDDDGDDDEDVVEIRYASDLERVLAARREEAYFHRDDDAQSTGSLAA